MKKISIFSLAVLAVMLSTVVVLSLVGCNASTDEDETSDISSNILSEISSATSSEPVSSEVVSSSTPSEESKETVTSVPVSSKPTSSKPTSGKPKPTSSEPPTLSEPIYGEDGTVQPNYKRTTGIKFIVTDELGNPLENIMCRSNEIPNGTAGTALDSALEEETYSAKTGSDGTVTLMLNSWREHGGTTQTRLESGRKFTASVTFPDGEVVVAESTLSESSVAWRTDFIRKPINPGKGNIIEINVSVTFLDE